MQLFCHITKCVMTEASILRVLVSDWYLYKLIFEAEKTPLEEKID